MSLGRGLQLTVPPFRHSRLEQTAKISKINQDPPSAWLSQKGGSPTKKRESWLRL